MNSCGLTVLYTYVRKLVSVYTLWLLQLSLAPNTVNMKYNQTSTVLCES